MCVCVRCSPSDSSTLLVVDLDELPEAAGVVVVGRLGVPEGLGTRRQEERFSLRSEVTTGSNSRMGGGEERQERRGGKRREERRGKETGERRGEKR